MAYQTFPDAKGGSRSLEKLNALCLPPLAGKSFLDVGCNEGFFCGFAQFEGASRVTGVDKSATAIRRATARFPNVRFLRRSWNTLPKQKFDVIVLASALHYAQDQEALIHQLMQHLTEQGLLVLELGIAPGGKDEWVKVTRSIDERWFPTRIKLGTMLANYAWKIMGHSVNQVGDPLQRYVVHIRKFQPYVYCLFDPPGSGKTTVARRLFEVPGLAVVSGDKFYYRIAQGKLKGVSAGLQELVAREFVTSRIDHLTRLVFEQGYGAELVQAWAKEGGFKDFALDTYLPEPCHAEVTNTLRELGYYVVTMSTRVPDETAGQPAAQAQQSARLGRVQAYQDHLTALAQQWGERARFHVEKCLPQTHKQTVRWYLDSPNDQDWLLSDEGDVALTGWVLTPEPPDVPLKLRVGKARVLTYSLTRNRPDVLKALFGSELAAPAFWQTHPCGFVFNVPIEHLRAGCVLEVALGNEWIPLARLGLQLGDKRTESDADAPGVVSKLGARFMRKLRGVKG